MTQPNYRQHHSDALPLNLLHLYERDTFIKSSAPSTSAQQRPASSHTSSSPVHAAMSFVSQRKAAQTATVRMKPSLSRTKSGNGSTSPSPAISPASPPYSAKTPASSSASSSESVPLASSPSAASRPSPSKNPRTYSKSRHCPSTSQRKISMSSSESLLSSESESEPEVAQLSSKPTSVESDQDWDGPRAKGSKRAFPIAESDQDSDTPETTSRKLPSPGRGDLKRSRVEVEPLLAPDSDLAQDLDVAPASVRPRRSAATTAKNNIQRSYSDFPGDDAEQTVTTPKKPRASTSNRAKLESKEEADVPFKPPKVPAPSRPRPSSSRAGATSSSQSRNRGRRFQDEQGTMWELQLFGCPKYASWRKCTQCISKRSGDTCRFAGFRAFAVDPATDELYAAGAEDVPKPAFISSPDADDVMDLPADRPLSPSSLLEAQTIVARSLLPVLDAELTHAEQPSVLRRPRETECRQMCEFCATSIFSASWYCRRCGREYCPDCKVAFEQPEIKDVLLERRLTQCDQNRPHTIADLVPLTRFDAVLLEQELLAMRNMLRNDEDEDKPDCKHCHDGGQSVARPSTELIPSAPSEQEDTPIDWTVIPNERAGLTADGIVGSHGLRTFNASAFDVGVFRSEWAHGEPLLVRHVTSAMQNPWGPEALQDRYGDVACQIVRSDTDPPVVEQVSVGSFFATFGQDPYDKEEALGPGSWKLKDWPPSAEFKAEFPELYADFNRAVPAPEYTTREGILNLGSCYPSGVIQPDLGPKMYNAWPASEGVRGHGTTRLHMDMADAVNIMLYASPPKGSDVPDEHKAGVAAWDIFRAEDADQLRAFLRTEYAHMDFKDDPIHIQQFFISAPQRVKLFRQYGVRSWRIYQQPGEAVFIPAGCAHQVCNLTDCIKVAVDFVSPQNVARCFKLTAEFRGLLKDYKKAWKEDVLSLKTTLWYAWCTYRQMSGAGPNVWAKEQRKIKEDRRMEEEDPEQAGPVERITRKVLQDA